MLLIHEDPLLVDNVGFTARGIWKTAIPTLDPFGRPVKRDVSRENSFERTDLRDLQDLAVWAERRSVGVREGRESHNSTWPQVP